MADNANTILMGVKAGPDKRRPIMKINPNPFASPLAPMTAEVKPQADPYTQAIEQSVSSVISKYPRLSRVPFNVFQSPAKPGAPPIESYPVGESYSPSPEARTLELRGQGIPQDDLENAIKGDLLHHLGSLNPVNDPEWRGLKDKFISNMPKEEIAFAKKRFKDHKKQFPEDNWTFEQWFDGVWADQWIRGLLAPVSVGDDFKKLAPKLLSKKQLEIVEEMDRLLQEEQK